MSQEARPSSEKRIPGVLVAGLMAAIVIDTILQLLWKQSALALPASGGPEAYIAAILHQPLFLLVGLLFAAQMVNWLKVLDNADVSYALPITALSYVSVAAFSAWLLHEHMTLAKMAGIALILGGVFLVARTGHDTAGDHR